MTVAYVDASALAKLVLREPESDAFSQAISGADVVVTSTVGRIEFERAVRRSDIPDAEDRIDGALAGVDVIPIHVAISAAAASTRPPELCTLDAIHLATMRALERDIDVAYIYDGRLFAAAVEYGVPVAAPR